MGDRTPDRSTCTRLVVMELGMTPEIFEDEVGQRIRTKMRNYAIEHYGKEIKGLDESLDRTCVIVGMTREAVVEALEAEISIMCFRNATGDEIPTTFIGGVLHAQDVVQGRNSMMGKS
jgi:hypothetical protein